MKYDIQQAACKRAEDANLLPLGCVHLHDCGYGQEQNDCIRNHVKEASKVELGCIIRTPTVRSARNFLVFRDCGCVPRLVSFIIGPYPRWWVTFEDDEKQAEGVVNNEDCHQHKN